MTVPACLLSMNDIVPKIYVILSTPRYLALQNVLVLLHSKMGVAAGRGACAPCCVGGARLSRSRSITYL